MNPNVFNPGVLYYKFNEGNRYECKEVNRENNTVVFAGWDNETPHPLISKDSGWVKRWDGIMRDFSGSFDCLSCILKPPPKRCRNTEGHI